MVDIVVWLVGNIRVGCVNVPYQHSAIAIKIVVKSGFNPVFKQIVVVFTSCFYFYTESLVVHVGQAHRCGRANGDRGEPVQCTSFVGAVVARTPSVVEITAYVHHVPDPGGIIVLGICVIEVRQAEHMAELMNECSHPVRRCSVV